MAHSFLFDLNSTSTLQLRSSKQLRLNRVWPMHTETFGHSVRRMLHIVRVYPDTKAGIVEISATLLLNGRGDLDIATHYDAWTADRQVQNRKKYHKQSFVL